MVRKRLYIFIGIPLLVVLTIFCLTIDFHSYKRNSKATKIEDNKLILSITTYDGKSETKPFLKVLGHSWISIDNQTNHEVKVMDYSIKPNEIITCSIWAISNHFGVVFNLEPEFISENGRYDGRRTISTSIEESDLDLITEFIENNNYWKFTKNCSYWSIHLWNSIVNAELQIPTQTLVYTPTRLEKAFSEFNDVKMNMEFNRAEGIFFYENGKKKEVILCK